MREVKLAKVRALTLVKHVFEVAQLARRQVEITDVFEDATLQSRCENLLSQTSRKCFFGFLMLLVVNRETIKDSELA